MPPYTLTFCSVLTAPQLGTYASMAAVSLLAVRHLHPGARIALLVDAPTRAALDRQGHRLLSVASEVVTVDTGTADPTLSSRTLKTTLRQWLSGDLLYLDVDAVPVRPIDSGWPMDVDLAAARDLNRRSMHPLTRIHQSVDATATRLGWRIDERRFLNTGVLWVRDTPAAHAFFAEWHRRWQKAAETGVAFDQPAFNSCVADGLARVGVLPDADNWMTLEASLFRGRARIFHFIASLGDSGPAADTLLFRLMDGFQRTGQFDAVSFEHAARQNLPWTYGLGTRRWLAAGHYLRAALAFARKRCRRQPR